MLADTTKVRRFLESDTVALPCWRQVKDVAIVGQRARSRADLLDFRPTAAFGL